MMIGEINRRRFVRASGTAIGMTTLSGLASARDQDVESKVNVNVETVTHDGVRYTASVSHNPESGEKDGFLLPGDSTSQSVEALSLDGTTLYEISDDVLNRLDESTFEGSASTQTASRSHGTGLWDQLSEASDVASESSEVRIQEEKELIGDVVDEIASGTKDSIDRLGAYYVKSKAGADCDAVIATGPHCQMGASVDYEEVLGSFTQSAIAGVVGAVIGYLVSSLPGAAIGGLAGAVAGFAVKRLKDSSNLTVILRDKDNCFFGKACQGEIDLFASGYWMDKEYELLHVPSPAPDIRHLNEVAIPDRGYEEVIRVSS